MILARYLSRLFALRFLAVLLALTALAELVELLAAIRRLLASQPGLQPVLIFSALKLPLTMEWLFPLAVLIGAALTFRTLAYNSEIVILRGAGLSPYRLLAALAPLTVVLAAAHFVLVDRVAPLAERNFNTWWAGIAAATGDPEDDGDPAGKLIWLRAGGEIVSVAKVFDGNRRLEGVTRYLRNADGQLTSRIRARSASLDEGLWHLHGVEIIRVEGATPRVSRVASLDWPGGPSASNLKQLVVPVERLSGAQSRAVLAGTWSGRGNAAHYRTLVQRSYCAPLLPFLMVLLAVPSLAGGRRTGGMAAGMAISLGMGLAFLIVNGFFVSMSEAGVVPAMLAVWSAPVIFAILGLTLLLHREE